ncbi:hypothetical protein [Dactylosporangium fulvum]|uniref:Uncharacterized protein n=1 Tax=Dactylosporangium fulvum TaxID=53359 RepID=A0ABY5W7R4_9ACTN|nr:hypothetical protein [Dactylosporangium fulvum]UWP85356.1 hypothetical protein Dfulv_14425 [Dactylosporangium fulvum]
MTVEAFDIWTGDEHEIADEAGDRPRLPAGWAGPDGPGIDVRTWPRSPRTGQPMVHCFTLRLPEAYRRRGPDLVAVAVFQWADELCFTEPLPEVQAVLAGRRADVAQPDHPFWAELGRSRRHTQLQLADDGVASLFAMVWLDETELSGPRVTRPTAAPELADGEVDAVHLRERYGMFGPVWLVRRDDPNAGIAPVSFPEAGNAYVEIPDRWDVFHAEHLGGTNMCPDGVREGLSPWYIEVSRLGGISHGGDQDLALDLDARAFLGDLTSAVLLPEA